jgi:hypothetical protein
MSDGSILYSEGEKGFYPKLIGELNAAGKAVVCPATELNALILNLYIL